MAGEAFSEYKFDELELGKELKRGIEKIGFTQMTPIQAEAIPHLLEGKDVIGQAQTGTGKTAAFGIPMLENIDTENRKLQGIILCPTRELAMQVTTEIRAFASAMQNLKILPVYGGQDIRFQIQHMKGVQLIVGTPGRVMDHMRRHTIKMDHIKMVVLDEADEMLKMGFREDMEVILGAIEQPHQTCLFSATMPQEILDITNQFQNDPQLIKVTPKELTIDRIEQYYYAVKREYKIQALIRLMAYHQYGKSIVFCNTKSMADELATQLREEGYHAQALHGDLSQRQRDDVMGNFRKGIVNVLTATDIAARGIDVDDVEAVFNYDIPLETEYYVHRIGRTGRAGRTGVSHTLCKSKEFKRIHEIERECHTQMKEKSIPTSESINENRINSLLEEVAELIRDGEQNQYYLIVKAYCKQHNLDVTNFAAAFLQHEIGEELEEIEIGLPVKPKKKSGEHKSREYNPKNRSSKNSGEKRSSRDHKIKNYNEKNNLKGYKKSAKKNDSAPRVKKKRHEHPPKKRKEV